MSVAMRYSHDKGDAKDLVHDTFVKIFTKIESYNPNKGSFDNWSTRILINIALQRFRKHKKMFFTDDILVLDKIDDNMDGLENLLAVDLLNIIKELPPGCRIVFTLYEIEGYKHKEIGEKIGINACTSRAHLTRAKKLLRARLKKDDKSEKIKSYLTIDKS